MARMPAGRLPCTYLSKSGTVSGWGGGFGLPGSGRGGGVSGPGAGGTGGMPGGLGGTGSAGFPRSGTAGRLRGTAPAAPPAEATIVAGIGSSSNRWHARQRPDRTGDAQGSPTASNVCRCPRCQGRDINPGPSRGTSRHMFSAVCGSPGEASSPRFLLWSRLIQLSVQRSRHGAQSPNFRLAA
jgi:hypothetical protein